MEHIKKNCRNVLRVQNKMTKTEERILLNTCWRHDHVSRFIICPEETAGTLAPEKQTKAHTNTHKNNSDHWCNHVAWRENISMNLTDATIVVQQNLSILNLSMSTRLLMWRLKIFRNLLNTYTPGFEWCKPDTAQFVRYCVKNYVKEGFVLP